jgi:hypothetical protein
MRWLSQKLSDWRYAYDRRKYGLGKYFITLPPDPLHATLTYRIIKGKYKGLEFCFTTVDITKEGGANFGFHVIGNNNGITNNTAKLCKLVRKILLNVLWDLYNGNGALQFGLKPGEEWVDEDRTSYIEEPDQERTLRAKGSTTHEE